MSERPSFQPHGLWCFLTAAAGNSDRGGGERNLGDSGLCLRRPLFSAPSLGGDRGEQSSLPGAKVRALPLGGPLGRGSPNTPPPKHGGGPRAPVTDDRPAPATKLLHRLLRDGLRHRQGAGWPGLRAPAAAGPWDSPLGSTRRSGCGKERFPGGASSGPCPRGSVSLAERAVPGHLLRPRPSRIVRH